MPKFTNKQVAKTLKDISACYELNNESLFKIRAYQNASDVISKAETDVVSLWQEGKLKSIPGIGASIEQHLNELFEKGSVAHFKEVQKPFPKGMFALLGVSGIGAKTAYKLSQEFNLDNAETAIQKLLDYAKAGKIQTLQGFGAESEKKIMGSLIESLEKSSSKDDRVLLSIAERVSQDVLEYLRKCSQVERADPLGSLRRRCSTVGDVDISVCTKDSKAVIDYFSKFPKITKILSIGDVKASVIINGLYQVDIMAQPQSKYGSLLQHFTGSKLHNIRLREFALQKGLSLSEYGIKNKKGELLEFDNEESFYKFLGLDFIPPELREDSGEIEASLNKKLPNLIELKDIKGDLQMHTTDSDGENSLIEMVEEAQKLGYEYMGITDHQLSLSTHTEGEIISIMKGRRAEIEQINYSHKGIRVLFGCEINVSADNRITYPDSILSKFDFVIGAIHSSFDQSKEEITQRLSTLIKNKFVKIIAHPSGRLIGEREPYLVDWEQIFEACAKYGKVLEINGQPSRQDLPDILVKRAVEKGVMLSTNTDAHSVEDLHFMPYAVSVACRGWCESKNVINTMSLEKLSAFLGLL